MLLGMCKSPKSQRVNYEVTRKMIDTYVDLISTSKRHLSSPAESKHLLSIKRNDEKEIPSLQSVLEMSPGGRVFQFV